jgi:long-chain fatty acid transport protein
MMTIAAFSSYGAGFAIIEQSVKGQGEAFSGGSTASDDASSVYFNPAGMSLTGKTELDAGAHLIMPQFSFKNKGSNYPMLGGLPVSGGDGGDAGIAALVPNVYYNQQLGNGLAAGLGLNAPFGLETEYNEDWVGRYHAIRTAMATFNINPALGYSINQYVAVGAGLNLQYVDVRMSQAIDFGGILASKGFPTMPQQLDGKVELKADDWGWGYNAGIMVSPLESTRIGLTYRSEVEYTLEGDADFDVPAQAAGLQAQGLFIDTDIKGDLTVPESISLGIAQQLPAGFTVKADILWTRWSRFQELRIKYDSNQPDSVTDESWNDTFRYALGVTYDYEKWVFRVGTAYDETPIPDSYHRTPRIPDANRIWASCGASYQATEALTLDAGYTHLFFNNSSIDNVGTTGDYLTGTYEGEANLLALQACYAF